MKAKRVIAYFNSFNRLQSKMNPLTNVKNITKLNETELVRGTKKSWHDLYKNSAWIFIGGLPYTLTEGDILAVFSQYGEIVNINLVRDKKTGKTRGYGFLCYANQKSTVLAVDNFNGIKLCNRTIRVDHVADYKPPKENDRDDEITKVLKSEGCAPKPIQINESNTVNNSKHEKKKKVKKEKKEKKQKKRKHKSNESDSDHIKKVKIKEEKFDPGYDKYDNSRKKSTLEKELFQERGSEKLLDEHSAHKKHRSEIPEKCHKNKGKSSERENIQSRSNSSGEERSRYKRKQESNASTSHGRRSVEEMKEYKRYSSSSSSSDDSSDSYSSEDSIRYQNDNKHLDIKSHRHKSKGKRDCNNSKYEDSSSESSSEKHKSQSNISEKENYKTRGEENTSQHKNKDKHRHRSESSDDEITRKDRQYRSKDEKYFDHKSKSKYKDESYYRHSSYHKKDKQDKR